MIRSGGSETVKMVNQRKGRREKQSFVFSPSHQTAPFPLHTIDRTSFNLKEYTYRRELFLPTLFHRLWKWQAKLKITFQRIRSDTVR